MIFTTVIISMIITMITNIIISFAIFIINIVLVTIPHSFFSLSITLNNHDLHFFYSFSSASLFLFLLLIPLLFLFLHHLLFPFFSPSSSSSSPRPFSLPPPPPSSLPLPHPSPPPSRAHLISIYRSILRHQSYRLPPASFNMIVWLLPTFIGLSADPSTLTLDLILRLRSPPLFIHYIFLSIPANLILFANSINRKCILIQTCTILRVCPFHNHLSVIMSSTPLSKRAGPLP